MNAKTKNEQYVCDTCGFLFYGWNSANRAKLDGCPKCGSHEIHVPTFADIVQVLDKTFAEIQHDLNGSSL